MNLIHECVMNERDVVSGMLVFVAVVEGGSLAAAARATKLTASAVSKLITRLEQGLGVRLLQRSTRSMTLTDAGHTFYERSCRTLEDLRKVESEVAGQDAEPRGLVRVSAPGFLGQTRVVPILLAFQARVPAVSLDLDLADRTVDMVAERIDVAVRITATPPASFVARRVGAIRRVLCASPAYLEKHGAPKSAADLSEHACLVGPSDAVAWRFVPRSGEAESEQVRVTSRLRANHVLAIHQAALAGLGIARLPHYLINDDLRAGRLTCVLEQFQPTERGVYVIYSAARLVPARVRALTRYLVTELEKVL